MVGWLTLLMPKEVTVEAYNPNWPNQFLEIEKTIWPLVKDFAVSIEHVGSTSVPGLAAKPILDIDLVIPDMSYLNQTKLELGKLGYEHRGNLGIQDREAFRATQAIYRHNLYVCPASSVALRNHLCLRDTLRTNSALRDEYAMLKYRLSTTFSESIDDYVEGKTKFILEILSSRGFGPDNLEAIRVANLAPQKKSEP
jgi:GrpB-like predicted nucleotidyltransferase (UPF0157 family)